MPLDETMVTLTDPEVSLYGLDGQKIEVIIGRERSGRRCHFDTCANASKALRGR